MKREWRISRSVPVYALFLLSATVLCFYESGDPEAPRKNGRPWAYSFLTLARFHPDWLTSTNPTPEPAQGNLQSQQKNGPEDS